MSIRMNNLSAILGFESDEVYEDIPSADNALAVADADASIEDEMANISSNLDTASNLANDAETLEKTEEVVDHSIETGEGLDSTAAAVMQETIESIYRRHGMPKRRWPDRFSLEARATREERIRAARQIRVSIEGLFNSISDGVSNIFDGLRNFFSKLWDSIRAFEENILKEFLKLKDRAGTLNVNNKEPMAINCSKTLPIANKEVEADGLVDLFEQSVRQIRSPSGLEHMINEFLKQYNGLKELNNERNIVYSKQMMEDFDRNIRKYKLSSFFSEGSVDPSSKNAKNNKPLVVNFESGKDIQRCCFPAIDLIKLKPMEKLEKISDGFIMHSMKSVGSWLTSEKGRKDAEGGLKYRKEGQMTSVREVMSHINSAYKYIMYENIKVYKETLRNYYKVLLEMASRASIGKI